MWRMHSELAPPVVLYPTGPKEVRFAQTWLASRTAGAPAQWTAGSFDDSGWLRGTALLKCRTPLLSRSSLRGKFVVADPARVGALSLSITYRGGVVVYVNGKEIARQHLPDGVLGPNSLAEAYPPEAFATETGGYLGTAGVYLNGRPQQNVSQESRRRLGLRDRTLENVTVPAGLIRKGVNVLAVQIVRAPYDAIMDGPRKGAKTEFV